MCAYLSGDTVPHARFDHTNVALRTRSQLAIVFAIVNGQGQRFVARIRVVFVTFPTLVDLRNPAVFFRTAAARRRNARRRSCCYYFFRRSSCCRRRLRRCGSGGCRGCCSRCSGCRSSCCCCVFLLLLLVVLFLFLSFLLFPFPLRFGLFGSGQVGQVSGPVVRGLTNHTGQNQKR